MSPATTFFIQKGTKPMSYDHVIAAVKSNPALAAELAGSTSWADTERILKAHGIDVPADVAPTAEQEAALAAVAGGGIPSGIYYPQ